MKKWFIACLLAMVLIFAATAAMAHTRPDNGAECEAPWGYTVRAGAYNDKQHLITCNRCGREIWENHWAQSGKGATCKNKATCGSCYEEYGGLGDHSWGAWKSNGNGTHTHTCAYDKTHTETKNCTYSAATCVAKATCTECGAQTGGFDRNNHDLEPHAGQAATCTEDGWAAYNTCKREGCGYTTYQKIDALKHDLVRHEAQAPTCVADGWEAYDTCSRCEYTTFVKLSIDPDNHDLEHYEAKAPTCTEMGWSAYDACKREGCNYMTPHTVTALGGHKMMHYEAKAPTCTEKGWEAYDACQRDGCDYTTYQEISALDHDWGDWVSNGDKTHTHTCKRDDSHTETEDCSIIDATCVSAARCDVCNGEYGEADPDNHDWNDWVSNGDGTHTRSCKRDASHTETEACSGVNCGETGNCSVCHGEYTKNHKFGDAWTGDAGGHWLSCIYCNAKGDKIYHSFAKYPKSEATCVSPAMNSWVCTDCGYQYESTSGDINPDNHDLEQHEAKAPTCTEIGWEAYETCKRDGCKHTTYKEIPALKHDLEQHEAKVPTCTEIGWDAYETCKREGCNYTTYSELPIDSNNHDLVHHEAKAATCTEIGWNAYDTCTRCDYTTYVELPALGHDYQKTIVQPTCEKGGYTRYTCARCEDTYTENPVKKLLHWYGEWSPNGDGTHSADCRREGCKHTGKVECEKFEYRLLFTDAEDYTFELCPVCGEVSDGARLELVMEALAKAEHLPQGELVLRLGDLQNGECILSVGFEYSGKLTQPTEPVEIHLPAELLEGYALKLLDADGTETELPFTVTEDTAAFTLNFDAQDGIPVRAIHLVSVQ